MLIRFIYDFLIDPKNAKTIRYPTYLLFCQRVKTFSSNVLRNAIRKKNKLYLCVSQSEFIFLEISKRTFELIVN